MASESPLILVVEDDRDTHDALSALLSDGGYAILGATTGRQALECARQHHPAMVLLDLGLPEINGLDVAQLLNQDPTTAAIPLVALTGSWLADDPAWLRSAGFVAALRKPFRAPELLAVVRRTLPVAARTRIRAVADRLQQPRTS